MRDDLAPLEEDAALEDFDRIFPLPRDCEVKPSLVPDYDQLMEFAFDHDDRRLKRFAGPLPRGERYNNSRALDGGGIGEGPGVARTTADAEPIIGAVAAAG